MTEAVEMSYADDSSPSTRTSVSSHEVSAASILVWLKELNQAAERASAANRKFAIAKQAAIAALAKSDAALHESHATDVFTIS